MNASVVAGVEAVELQNSCLLNRANAVKTALVLPELSNTSLTTLKFKFTTKALAFRKGSVTREPYFEKYGSPMFCGV